MNLLTVKESYLVMLKYLEAYALMTSSYSIKNILNILKYNEIASYKKWSKCVQKISSSSKHITSLEAFNAMRILIEQYDPNHSDDDISLLLSETQIFQDGITADPAAWSDWLKAVNELTKHE